MCSCKCNEIIYKKLQIDDKIANFVSVYDYNIHFICIWGTIIGKHTNIYPLSRVRGVIMADSIYKSADNIVLKENR